MVLNPSHIMCYQSRPEQDKWTQLTVSHLPLGKIRSIRGHFT